jgi:hypothetical protein
MKVELELTNMVGKVLLRPESSYGLTAIPNVGDTVSIESKQWEVAKRNFHFQANGSLHKIAVQCRENDF